MSDRTQTIPLSGSATEVENEIIGISACLHEEIQFYNEHGKPDNYGVLNQIEDVLRRYYVNRETTASLLPDEGEGIYKEALRHIFRYTTNHQRDYAVKEMDDIYKIAFKALEAGSTSAQMRDLAVNNIAVGETENLRETFLKYIDNAQAKEGKLQDRITSLEHENARFKAALEKIASWRDGPVVTGRFDEPDSAKTAREALGKTPSDGVEYQFRHSISMKSPAGADILLHDSGPVPITKDQYDSAKRVLK